MFFANFGKKKKVLFFRFRVEMPRQPARLRFLRSSQMAISSLYIFLREQEKLGRDVQPYHYGKITLFTKCQALCRLFFHGNSAKSLFVFFLPSLYSFALGKEYLYWVSCPALGKGNFLPSFFWHSINKFSKCKWFNLSIFTKFMLVLIVLSSITKKEEIVRNMAPCDFGDWVTTQSMGLMRLLSKH